MTHEGSAGGEEGNATPSVTRSASARFVAPEERSFHDPVHASEAAERARQVSALLHLEPSYQNGFPDSANDFLRIVCDQIVE